MNRNQRKFNDLWSAQLQATALADFYTTGRWCVYEVGDHYVIKFDESKVRDGVNESDILFEAHSHCNSGTKSYAECREYAEIKLINE